MHTLKTLMKESSILLMPERPHVLLDQVVDESRYPLSSVQEAPVVEERCKASATDGRNASGSDYADDSL